MSLRSASSSALMDPAARLNHSAPLIPSWLSHREDADRLFGTDPLEKLRCDVGWSQPGALHGQPNKQLTATRWDDAQSLHGETNNSLCHVETSCHKQLGRNCHKMRKDIRGCPHLSSGFRKIERLANSLCVVGRRALFLFFFCYLRV